MTAAHPITPQDSALPRWPQHWVPRAVGRWVGTAVLALGATLGTAGLQQAQANSLVWSVGVSAPGAVVQVGSHPPPRVVYQPAPVQVVVNPGWNEPRHRHGPPPRWYGPHASAGHGHHHRGFYDDHRRGNRHGWRDRDGYRDDDRGGRYVRPDNGWDHRR